MDYKKIGTFIAQERKTLKMTQEQFAEKLFVSPKTVSKWENGNGLPNTDLLYPICEIFDITLNELLSGERLTESAYKEKAEDNISILLATRKTNKQKIIFSAINFAVCFSMTLICLCLSSYIEMATWLKICLIIYGIGVLIFGLAVGIYYDIKVGSFKCRKCGKKFIPTPLCYILTTHTVTTRLLKCPYCGKWSNCKKTLNDHD